MSRLDDQELLLGSLLVQCGFLSDATWNAIRNEWPGQASRSLEEILLQRGLIDRVDIDAVRALVDHRRSRPVSLSQRDLSPEIVDPDATRIPDSLEDSRSDRDDPLATRLPDPDEVAAMIRTPGFSLPNRYRKLRDHAKGGLGIVYVALDRELNREVALKEIQNRHADNATSQARFLLEAEITGGLEHPGIVPVYGLGHHEDGRPYYAMRFIRGDSLKDAIAAFHADKTLEADPGQRLLALQKLLRRFTDVCNAVAYAHSRGVLHRDLKPDNVMVGPYGETLVVDWGLAKVGERSDSVDSAEAVLVPSSSSSGSNETIPGSIIGTPAYMSPEQASGRLDVLGPAGDVYSLGATLYVLLTGENPIQAPDVLTLLDRAARGEFPPPRQINPSVPKALEAVCLKAMGLKPEDRYGSPRDLAAEIDRWTADEPVLAYREPFRVRAARWARRHRTLVSGVVVLLLTGGVALSAGYVLVRRERDQKAVLFERAQKTVKDYLVTIANDRVLLDDATSPVRYALLQKAGDYYRLFLEENRNNPDLRRESADAYYNLGMVSHNYALSREDGKSDEEAALDWHRKALELRQEQAKSTPSDSSTLYEVALSEEAVANQERKLSGEDRTERARVAYLEAIGFLERLVETAQGAELVRYRTDLARTSHHLGTLLIEVGRRDEALGPIRKAIETQELGDARGTSANPESQLANYLADLSEWHRKGGEIVEAIRLAREVLRQRENALGALATNTQTRRLRFEATYLTSLAENNLANLLFEAREVDEARTHFQKASALLEPLVKAFPLRTDFRSVLADVDNGLGESKLVELTLARSKGETDRLAGLGAEAIAFYERHREISLALEAEKPGVGLHRAEVARSDRNIGFTRYILGQLDEAFQRTRGSLDRLEPLVVAFPNKVEFRSDLGAAWNNMGLILVAKSQFPDAIEAYRSAIRHLQIAYARSPQFRSFLFTAYANLAGVERGIGQVVPAVAALTECRRLAVAQPMESVGVALELLNCLPARGEAEPEPGFARRVTDLALESVRQGVEAGFTDHALLKSIEAFAPLREREDYRRLIEGLESRSGGKPSKAPSP